jgi:hypothetical protein
MTVPLVMFEWYAEALYLQFRGTKKSKAAEPAKKGK